VISSAPAKVILFGEHAVVYGKPAIAVAINLRTRVYIERNPKSSFTVNGWPMDDAHHAYIKKAIEEVWGEEPLKITTESEVPSASGMGSSASITVAMVSALLAMKGKDSEEKIARKSFDVEWSTQGRASPIDTSTVTHGQGILVSFKKERNFLWKIERGGTEWYIHHVEIPPLRLVVGFSGVKGPTPKMVEKVRRFYTWNSFARDVIEEIGKITMAALEPLENEDYPKIGELMDRNNKLLTILGVSHPKLKKMIDAARKHSYGAKITGAGGGGCMLALTDEQDEVARAIREAGGIPFKVSISKQGYRIESHL